MAYGEKTGYGEQLSYGDVPWFPIYQEFTIEVSEQAPRVSAEFVSPYGLDFSIEEPNPVVSVLFNDGVINIVEPAPVVAVEFATGRVISIGVSEPAPAVLLDFSGQHLFSVAVVEPAPSVIAEFSFGDVLSVSVTEKKPKLSVTFAAGKVIDFAAVEPEPVVQAGFYWVSETHIAVVEPAPIVSMVVSSSITIIIADNQVSAWTINAENAALSEYMNYQFKGLSAFDGKLYGIRSDGVYSLSQEDDEGAPILWEFLTGQSDFDSDRLKRVPLVHADISGGDGIDILVEIDDVIYPASFHRGRAKPGRGARGNRIAFGAKGEQRATIRSIEPSVEILKKRAL